MRHNHNPLLASLAALALLAAGPALAQPPDNPPATRVAVVNVSRVMNDMAETRALQEQMDAIRIEMEREHGERERRIRRMQEAQIDDLVPGTPEWEQRSQEILKARIDLGAWEEYQTILVQQRHRREMTRLFERVREGSTDVARDLGFDLVIAMPAEPDPQMIEQFTAEQLQALLTRQIILFASQEIDITAAVLAHLDAQYQAGQQ